MKNDTPSSACAGRYTGQPAGRRIDGPERHHRRSIRLNGYDYSQSGGYFITIVVRNRLCLFGEVEDGFVKLGDAGGMIGDQWRALPARFPTLQLDTFVVMPNHIHAIILLIQEDTPPVWAPILGAPCIRTIVDPCIAGDTTKIGDTGATTRVAPTVGDVVGAFKSLTSVAYARGMRNWGWPPFSGRLWQRNYYEHIIRNPESLNRIREYIATNPSRWSEDAENPGGRRMNREMASSCFPMKTRHPVGAPLVGAHFVGTPLIAGSWTMTP
ncbi:MAG: transposase [Candidatus Latescibacterota bacterium]